VDTSLLLRHVRSVTDFPDEEFERFIQLFEPFYLRRGEHFYKAGEVPTHSPFIVKGCLRQYTVNEDGDEQILRFIEEDNWAGQVGSMRTGIPTDLYLQALEDCEILGITIANADYGMDTIPAYRRFFGKKYPADHAQLLYEANRIKTETPESLYLWLMNERPSLIRRVPQHYIASYLGVRTETLSRIRNKIARNGIC